MALCACGVKQEAVSSSQPKPFTVMLEAPPSANHAALYSAIAHGEFRAAGLDVIALTPASPREPLELLAAGKADMAISSEPELLLARDRGLALVSVAALAQRPLASVAMLPGQTLPQARAPTYDGLVLVVRQRQAERQGEDLRAFLHALTRGQQEVRADPAAAAALLDTRNGAPRQRPQPGSIERALPSSYPTNAAEPYGYQDPAAWASFAAWMYSQGFLHTNPSALAPPFTNEFLPGQGL
jgi:ABC-type nitrate/sulfonate/bicarbonate transport system substrate-binding protein